MPTSRAWSALAPWQLARVAFTAKHAAPGRGWAFVREDQARVPVSSRWGSELAVTRTLYERGGTRQLVSSWYVQPGRRVVGSRHWGRAWMLWDYLTRFRSDVALERLATPSNGGAPWSGFEQHQDFIRDALPALERYFGR